MQADACGILQESRNIDITRVAVLPEVGLTTDILPDGKVERFKEYRLELTIAGSFDDYLKMVTQLPAKEIEDGMLHYGEKDGFARYGFESRRQKAGHGGLWSSNPGCIKRLLGKDVLDVTVIPDEGWHMAGSITLELAGRILPDGYMLAKRCLNDTYGIRKKEDHMAPGLGMRTGSGDVLEPFPEKGDRQCRS